MSANRDALVRYRVGRAREALQEARVLLDAGHVAAAVNREYYACFYAAAGLLLTEGRSSPRHSGVRALFNQHWVKPGRVAVALGRTYGRLFVRRQRGDYADLTRFDPGDVRAWLDDAREFVEVVAALAEAMLGRVGGSDPG